MSYSCKTSLYWIRVQNAYNLYIIMHNEGSIFDRKTCTEKTMPLGDDIIFRHDGVHRTLLIHVAIKWEKPITHVIAHVTLWLCSYGVWLAPQCRTPMGQIVAERTEVYGYSVYNIYNRVWMQRNFSLPSTSLDDLGSICNLQYDYEN